MPEESERILTIRELLVDPGQGSERIDRWITEKVAGATRNKVQEAIAAGAVLVNERPTKANYRVRPGDVIRLSVMKPPPITLVAEDIPLVILYEDEHLLVVDKPAGMVTHPGFGNRTGTLVNAVLGHVGAALLEAGGRGGEYEEESDDASVEEEVDDDAGILAAAPFDYDAVRPGVVHRLDKETSGVMVVAKTAQAKARLGAQFAERTIRREYRAVTWGVVDQDRGDIEGNIARDRSDRKRFVVHKRDGKYALTHYDVVERYDFATLLSLRLATGRTHQIRVHCAHIGHPLVGDKVYGGAEPHAVPTHDIPKARRLLRLIDRQALHARTLGFTHPATGEYLEFSSEMPEDMVRVVEMMRGGT